MIRRTAMAESARVEFIVATTDLVSVVGDFNGWNALAGGMSTTGDGTRVASVMLAPGRYAFRYVNGRGEFFDDPDADAYEPNGHGQVHGLLFVDFVAASMTGEPQIDLGTSVQDDRIGQWFRKAVAGHPYLANADIDYFVEDQVIHLEGFVSSRLAKQALWDLAWGVREIRDVDARIAIATRG
jgi:hypothetical protein